MGLVAKKQTSQFPSFPSFPYNDRMDRESPAAPAPPPVRARRGLLAALRETTFRSLRHRNYRRYFLGQIVSFTGSWMQSAALMWLLYDRTGDPRWPSWVLVAQVGPTLLLGTWWTLATALSDAAPL